MTNRNLLLSFVLAGVAVSGIVLGQSTENTASGAADSDSGEWEMFSGNVVALEATGGGSTENGAASAEGPVFIYNTRTGKVYRIFTGCGDLGVNGCIEALPVVMEGQFTTVVPQPQSGGGQIRR
jgi:hypothetical protein